MTGARGAEDRSRVLIDMLLREASGAPTFSVEWPDTTLDYACAPFVLRSSAFILNPPASWLWNGCVLRPARERAQSSDTGVFRLPRCPAPWDGIRRVVGVTAVETGFSVG